MLEHSGVSADGLDMAVGQGAADIPKSPRMFKNVPFFCSDLGHSGMTADGLVVAVGQCVSQCVGCAALTLAVWQ